MSNEQYLGNPNLKRANVTQEFTPEEVEEYLKCAASPVYFIKKYIKIVSLDKGLIPFCLLYTSPSPRDAHESRMPSSA